MLNIPGSHQLLNSSHVRERVKALLRSVTVGGVWNGFLLGKVGAVLSLLDGPTGCDPCFCVVWFRFRFLRRYLALWPAEVGRVYRLLEMVGEGCPGHGPLHLFRLVLLKLGFFLGS